MRGPPARGQLIYVTTGRRGFSARQDRCTSETKMSAKRKAAAAALDINEGSPDVKRRKTQVSAIFLLK